MKKVIAIVVLLLIAFVVYNRNRLYWRAPAGTVIHDNTYEQGAQVFTTFRHDVLVENDNPPAYTMILQQPDRIGAPKELMCLHWLVCLADADTVTFVQARPDLALEPATPYVVSYRDAQGHLTAVKLR